LPVDDDQELHRAASTRRPEPSRYLDAFAPAKLLIGYTVLISITVHHGNE
jgi:hypothetical protein